MPKLILEKDVPEIIALTATTGKIQPSTIEGAASDVRFTLVDGRAAYFPFNVADQIRAAGIQAGVPFEITQIGNRTKVRIRNVGVSRDYTPELERSIEMANGRNGRGAADAGTPAAFTSGTAPGKAPVAEHSNGSANGVAARSPARPLTDAEMAAQFGPEPPAAANGSRQTADAMVRVASREADCASKYMAFYKCAVDILLETRAYAQGKGLPLDITCESIRCLAATIAIGQNGGSR